LSAAKDPDEYVRERAIQALGQSGRQQAITAVLSAFDDNADFVRWRAVQAATRLGVRDVDDRLVSLAGDRFWRVRLVTYQLLGEIGQEIIVNGSPELAASPAGERVKKLLLAGLADPDERSRVAAARALATAGDPAAFAPLVELMDTGSMFIRHQAALGLGDLGDKQAITPLIEALEDPRNNIDPQGRDWAHWGMAVALEKITGQSFKTDASRWRQWLASENK
jgi:HEAT repeat protein